MSAVPGRATRIAALLIGALAAPALAQSIPVPPTRELIDDNGVDLFRGTYTVDQTVAVIGGGQVTAIVSPSGERVGRVAARVGGAGRLQSRQPDQ
jgi:hypothetical protein